MPNEMILFEQTDDLLHDSAQIIESARKNAYQTVDRVLILRNWLLGKRIAGEYMNGGREERYGERIIADLAEKLTAKYGSGFDKRSLYRYVKFYRLYPEIVATLKPQCAAWNLPRSADRHTHKLPSYC